eukprot:14176300-Ditylum_brightwellii.AAC.1
MMGMMLQMQQQQTVVYSSNGSCQCNIVPVSPGAAVKFSNKLTKLESGPFHANTPSDPMSVGTWNVVMHKIGHSIEKFVVEKLKSLDVSMKSSNKHWLSYNFLINTMRDLIDDGTIETKLLSDISKDDPLFKMRKKK